MASSNKARKTKTQQNRQADNNVPSSLNHQRFAKHTSQTHLRSIRIHSTEYTCSRRLPKNQYRMPCHRLRVFQHEAGCCCCCCTTGIASNPQKPRPQRWK
ncbi:hypothetical protein JMJ77_0004752 [Colletotrichum scovillei]|uniref:Uncharacterized protein n=1 Tax=Colletotrichum scovillei TaxID=1209932 RepID=A0A9P7RF57_9PEZI|nr:hypothetical protein JMJ77_0004752 [Colletotrichum scovillei]KAG7075959.1 hypothetical protein JMJ76_0013232 [Colletotrichum scovillei]KAG7083103.1 hypothetical protein JMJ78_0008553 [Colletotrichum scovillei]